MLEGIRRLQEALDHLEQEIGIETEKLKALYQKAADFMPDDKSYYLNGVQIGSVVKAYLLTSQGVGVQGEGVMSIPEFIDAVMRFANYPKRKVEVLGDLAEHLEKIHAMLGPSKLSRKAAGNIH